MSDCIKTDKCLNENGYGQDRLNGKPMRAHKVAWIEAYGEVPDGMVIDHKCHNEAAKRGECSGGLTCAHRACINVEHLQLTTQSQNVLNGMHSIDVKASCPKGHSYKDSANIMIRANGKRECAECNRERSKRNWANRFAKAGK